jgi:hypothetical protein
MGYSWFEEEGFEVSLFHDTVYIELNDIFESEDIDCMDFKNCFNKKDIKK